MQIVSRDRLFARALQITLERAGFQAVHLSTFLPDAAHSPLVVDLDDFEVPTACTSVSFSSSADKHADLTRPFLMNELVELCRDRFAHDRSSAPSAPTVPSAPTPPAEPLLRFTDNGVLLNGQPVPLSPSEAALLRLLLSHAGECVPKEEIDRLWKGSGNMTEVYIRYLRKKLDEPTGLRLIRTVRGKGYILCLPNTAR